MSSANLARVDVSRVERSRAAAAESATARVANWAGSTATLTSSFTQAPAFPCPSTSSPPAVWVVACSAISRSIPPPEERRGGGGGGGGGGGSGDRL